MDVCCWMIASSVKSSFRGEGFVHIMCNDKTTHMLDDIPATICESQPQTKVASPVAIPVSQICCRGI